MKCRARKFIDNAAIFSTPEICFGGNGTPECEFLEICIMDNRVIQIENKEPEQVQELDFGNGAGVQEWAR